VNYKIDRGGPRRRTGRTLGAEVERMGRARTLLVAGCGVAVLLLLSGCERRQRAAIVQHPQWEYQDYRRLAVLPFRVTRREAAEAARHAEYRLVDLLSSNGGFTVLTRSDLKAVLTEQDLALLADVADAQTMLPQRMIQVAQAVVIGTIADCELKADQIERRVPRYARDRQGRLIINRRTGLPLVVAEDVYTEVRHSARLTGNVQVIDVATGRVLLSHTVGPIEQEDFGRGRPPRATPAELAIAAAEEIATEFYRKIAPQRVEVKLPGDCLLIASGYYEGEYAKLKRVPVTLPEFLLVARSLPSTCDRNDFRLAISPKDRPEYLVEHAFTWSASMGSRGEALRVPVELLTGSGAEEFTAKLFAAGQERPILTRDFRLERPKAD